MDSYFDKVFHRGNLEQIRNFILYGVETENINNNKISNEVVLKNSIDELYNELETRYKAIEEFRVVENKLLNALTNCEAVYFEMGLKIGVDIVHQLLLNKN